MRPVDGNAAGSTQPKRAAEPAAAADGVRKPRCARQRSPRQSGKAFGGPAWRRDGKAWTAWTSALDRQ